MAKQTFTTGQVLTAAQMTSLQQTAMGGGAATAKTASYVLVAADAGTTVAMNAAGATTITVNTGLFAAGDTVFIQNLGAGACTVTAGTATVATAGSAILPQNDAGILYFTATGASIFYDFIQVGAASPLTTKGDLYTFSTSDTRIGVGANGTTLVADSSEATGLKWQAPASGSTFAGCRLTNAGFTTTTGTNATVAFAVETYDTDAYHDNATNNSRATIPAGKAGYYYIQISGDWATHTSGTARYAFLLLNGATLATGTYFSQGAFANPEPSNTLSTVLYLAVADYVQMRVFQDRGGNLDFNNATMTLAYLGA